MPGTILFGVDVECADENTAGFIKYAPALFHELDAPVTWFVTGRTLTQHARGFQAFKDDSLIELQSHTYDHLLLKTVLMRVPDGKTIHGSMDWYLKQGSSVAEIDQDLARCQKCFVDILGQPATALTGPWGYYRGLGDRLDLLEIVQRHGFRVLRTFARNEDDGQPVPLEWKPFFYTLQGYPDLLECYIHDYQDDFYWEAFADPGPNETYLDYLKTTADKVAAHNLTWSLASHDHHCATREGFEQKGVWFRGLIQYAKSLGIRFMTISQYYDEMCAVKQPYTT
ncbi:MAG: polysaccharide deacetylase family protein [Chloroflexota bacterium]